MQWVPWLISGLMLMLNVIVFATSRSDKGNKDLDEMKTSLLKLNMKSDQICATTNETRSDIKSMTRDIQALETRVSVAERDIKTAFNRIDEIRGE